MTRTARYERALNAVELLKRFAMLLLDCAKWVETGSWQRSKDAGVVKLRDGDASALAAGALGHLSHQLRKKGKHLAAETLLPAIGRVSKQKSCATLRSFSTNFSVSTRKSDDRNSSAL